MTNTQLRTSVWANPLLVSLYLFGALVVLSRLDESDAPERRCSVCGRCGHNRTRCPYDGPRASLSHMGAKSARCECCDQKGYAMQRHHTRGRADNSDYLDVCYECHLFCCHRGSFQEHASKPLVCRVLNRTSFSASVVPSGTPANPMPLSLLEFVERWKASTLTRARRRAIALH